MRRPRRLILEVGPVCEAGQHKACCAVGDPFDDESEAVWVCSCECHRAQADREGR